MMAYVITQGGAQKLLSRTQVKSFRYNVPLDGYPFNKAFRKDLQVFVNLELPAVMNEELELYAHNKLKGTASH